MGRPLGSKTKPKPHDAPSLNRKSIKNQSPKKICVCCQKSRATTFFYKSLSPLSADHLSEFCKDCTVSFCLDENGNANADKLRTVCQQLNRPFINTVFDAAVNEFNRKYLAADKDGNPASQAPIIQLYMKNIGSLPQYSRLNYEQGLQYEVIQISGTNVKAPNIPTLEETHENKVKAKRNSERLYLDNADDEDDVDQDTISRFGEGFSRSQYRQFEKKYRFLCQSYGNYSALHEEALVNYVRYRVLEEESVAKGDIESAEKWSALANKAAAAAKINPSQIKEADDQGGFSFSEFNAAIERASDVIKILPQFKESALDSVDLCLYVYIQYVTMLLGKPPVEYKDIYKFYDDAVDEYIKSSGDPYGVFKKEKKNSPTKRNRIAVEKFVDIPKTSQASYFSGEQ